MSGVSITHDLDEKEVLKRINELIILGKDPAPVMKAFGDYKVKETIDLFDQEKDPEGKPWHELSDLTLKRKKGTRILTESTDLRNNIYRVADSFGVRVGTNKIYGAAHQFGLKKTLKIPAHRRKVKARNKKGKSSGVGFVKAHEREVKLPARRYLGFTDEDLGELEKIIKDWLEL